MKVSLNKLILGFTLIVSLKVYALSDSLEKINFQHLNSKVYLVGEIHTQKSADKIAIKLFEELMNHNKVNALILEQGDSFAYIMEEIIYNGQGKYLKYLRSNDAKKYLASYQKLYLSKRKKIRIYGISNEDPLYFVFLSALMIKEKYKLSDFCNKIDLYNIMSTYRLDDLILNWENIWQLKESWDFSKSKDLKNEEQQRFDKIMKNLIYTKIHAEKLKEISLEGRKDEFNYREIFMTENFLSLLKENPELNFFGSFGSLHIIGNQTENNCTICPLESLAYRLNENNINICTFLPIYKIELSYTYLKGLIRKEHFDMFQNKKKRQDKFDINNSIYKNPKKTDTFFYDYTFYTKN